MKLNIRPFRFKAIGIRMIGIGFGLIFLLATAQCRSTFPNTPVSPVPIFGIRTLWPHQTSDLAPDPEIVFGTLSNGVRYVLKENQTPKDRVSMHLYIQAGALMENEQEQGAAHFLEHMLFNGTTHFPPGEMVKYFQRIGMQFGPDANAHTGFDRTVYDVLLPKGNSDSLSEGLLVLRDYADGALLLPHEVEKERKVILSEMRSRDSANYRTLKAMFNFEMPDCLVSCRFPIGQRDALEKMDNQLLRSFYEAWYQPERLFVVIVGDFKSDDAKKLIAKHFGDLKAKSPARELPDFGNISHEGIKGFYHYENEIGATKISLQTLEKQVQSEDTREGQRQKLLRSLALQMMQKRLDQLLQRPECVMTSASVAGGFYLQQIKYTQLQATSKPEQWKESLAAIEQSLRSALEHGFVNAELQLAKDHLHSDLRRQIQQSDTRDSKALAREIIASLCAWHVIQSPTQAGDLLLPMIEEVTLESVNKAFSDLWSADHRLILVTGNADLTGQHLAPAVQIQNVYKTSLQTQVRAYSDQKIAKFPYLSIPTSSGAIDENILIDDLGIHRIVFANGIHLYLKPTNYKSNQVLAALSFGGGLASEPVDQPGLATLTEAVVNESGFGGLDCISLEDALAGRLASAILHIREDMFVIKGEAVTSELPLLFQLLHAFIEDPGYRDDARHLVLKRLEQDHQSLVHSTDGVMQLFGHKFLAGGDSRFGMPALSDLQQRTLDQIKQWFGMQLKQAPLELSLVGDFNPEVVVSLAAQYLGTLPHRAPGQLTVKRPGPVFPNGKSLQLTAISNIQKAMVVVAFPTEDFWQIGRTRRLAVMADLFSERLRQRIRENLGAAYSPYAYNVSHRSYPGYGMTKIYIQIDPQQVSDILNEVRYIADQMTTQPPDPDEFRRVLDPTLTQIKDYRQTNTYWLNSVLTGASRHPEQLEWCRTFADDYAAITSMEITTMARRYIDNDKAATIIIAPKDNP
jgi:zinc protease